MRKRKWLWFFLALALVDGLFLIWWLSQKKEHRYDDAIVAAAGKYGVHPALIKAVVWKESRFEADARGSAQELGLMQIREPAAMEWAEAEKRKGFKHKDLLDPNLNVMAGTWYLRKLMRRYLHLKDPLPYALADYNAGRTHVLRWNKGEASTNSAAFMAAMDYPTTKQYILDVTERFKHYEAEFPKVETGKR
ncbi:MAG: mltE [Verrucomicrobia bacterium]|jgi:soluble lytic murein transglycosylase|nr:mltE [Verrucomicrobiota bacterium]